MGDDDRDEAAFDDAAFGDAAFGDAEGFKPLSGELRPEVRELAEALRRLLKGSGKSQRQFAVYHHIGVSTVSRYLSGERIPDKHFLDGLMKSACKAHGKEVSEALQGLMYRLHREALLAEDPARYREQMASDRLEDAVLREEEAQLEIRELRKAAKGQKQQLWALESQLLQLAAAEQQERGALRADLERHRMRKEELEEACARLRDKVARLERALQEAEQEREAARTRCRELEAELAVAQEAAERAELERQAREERLRLAKAAEVAEHRLADLERVHLEAEQVRLAAAREAATQLEEAKTKADELLQEATLRATKVRPPVLRRSAALRQLKEAAQQMAEVRLPELAKQLSQAHPEDVDIVVRPIGIHSLDDIGQTAQALDTVHRAYVQLAVDQALLRSNANAMFINLSRRSQGLVMRQLSLISDLEESETDPDRLSSLFKLDHLATRMRRNCENLLVLAGEEPGRSWTRPVPVVDVLRAAASEVEQYERVELADVPSVEIAGRVVTDLVHLLAELLENATTFSSPHTRVKVTGHALPEGRVLIEIHDTGIGLFAEDLTEANELLAAPPVLDMSVARRMGLFVVGALSHRHGIRVQLRPSDTGGTTALVMLPVDAREFVPEQPYAGHVDHEGGQLPPATAHLFTICDSGHLSIDRPHS
ncbi:ATP-binding protein [Streptomyces sp. NPDC001165]|uniref:ATP-binding protein n=1 Tax=Streptomyces sp. NPDC001165 TaxID=3364546 RepID=UPI00368A2E92